MIFSADAKKDLFFFYTSLFIGKITRAFVCSNQWCTLESARTRTRRLCLNREIVISTTYIVYSTVIA